MHPRLLAGLTLGASLALLPASDQSPGIPFDSITTGPAVQDTGRSRGVAWGDYDGDGRPDLFVSRWEGPPGLYRNRAGTLERVDPGPGLAAPVGVESGAWVDLDGDGDLDLFVVSRTAGRAFLLRNEGGGRLVPLDSGGLRLDGIAASMACWADVERDGDLDVFVLGYRDSPNRLLRNDGNWRFAAVPLPAAALGAGEGRACAWGDLDNDGHPDLYIANAQRPNVLVRNLGGWSLDAAPHEGTGAGYGYGVSWADPDGDGDLDLFVANFDRADLLFENRGGRLEPVRRDDPLLTDSAGASKGHVWGDFDNDGDEDLYVAHGTPAPGMRNALFLNDGRGRFIRGDGGASTTDADTSAGVAAADVDGDGDLDLYAASWGSPGSGGRLYLNRSPQRSWIAIRLRSPGGNRFAVGAHVQVRATIGRISRWQHRWVLASTGYAGQSSYDVHFGLADATRVDSVVVRWPDGRDEGFGPLAARRRWIVSPGGRVTRSP